MAIKNNFPEIRPSLDLNFAGSKVVEPRVTFTRPSTATYYDGKTVAKAEENLLPCSQSFDNVVWTKAGVTVTSNTTTAPDGTTTASTVQQTGSGGADKLLGPDPSRKTGVQATTSIYVKAGTTNFVGISLENVGAEAGFDLSSGTITYNALGTAFITAIGDGWYRIGLTRTTYTTLRIVISDTVITTSVYSSGSGIIYIWGAQLEQRGQATVYTPTTDQPITRYQPVLMTAAANTPRITHNPVTGECLGLLVEYMSANLLTWSEQFDKWNQTLSAIAPNQCIAPSGELTADLISLGTPGGGYYQALRVVSKPANTCTFSVYFKNHSLLSESSLWIRMSDAQNALASSSATFNVNSLDLITSKTHPNVVLNDYSVTPVGNGWFRLSITSTFDTAITQISVGVGAEKNSGASLGGFYVWGGQLEAEALATSYIKTEASQVTRGTDFVDIADNNFSSWFNSEQGCLLMNCAPGPYLYVLYWQLTGRVGAYDKVMYNKFGNIFPNTTAPSNFAIKTSSNKAAYAYLGNEQAVVLNGGTVSSSANPTVFSSTRKLTLGSYYTPIKRLTYYPKRLSNAQLQALTL